MKGHSYNPEGCPKCGKIHIPTFIGHTYGPEGCPKCGKIHIPAFQGKHHTEETKKISGAKISLANSGKVRTEIQRENYSRALTGLKKSKTHGENLSKALKGKHCNPDTEFNSENQSGEKNSFYGKHHSEETILCLSEKTSKRLMDGYGKVLGHYYSIKNEKDFCYRSNWELNYMKILEKDDNVISYKYEPFKIKYLDEKLMKRFTVPDFLIRTCSGKDIVVEIRPIWRLNNLRTRIGMKAVGKYCEENDLQYIWINNFDNINEFNWIYLVI